MQPREYFVGCETSTLALAFIPKLRRQRLVSWTLWLQESRTQDLSVKLDSMAHEDFKNPLSYRSTFFKQSSLNVVDKAAESSVSTPAELCSELSKRWLEHMT